LITKTLVGLALTWCAAACAQDFHPLNIKPGEWQSTMKIGMPAIPPEALAKMPPEQRAKFEEMMTQPHTSTNCVKKEKLDKPLNWGHVNKSCTNTMVNSTGTLQEIRFDCSSEKSKSSGTIRIEVLSPESIKGSVHIANATKADQSRNFDSSFSAKWIGPTCTKED
jgi:Protein of unknown function (DUF3617)